MHSDNVSTTATMTRDRKSTKPIMEKRRRARINASLAELKSLLLEVIKREGARHSKMEKADILEMTVKHLREIQKHSNTASPDASIVNKHRLGFSECTQEVSRFLSNIDGCDVELRTRLLDHLANIVCGTESEKSPPSPTTSPLPVTTPPPLEQLPQSNQNCTSGDPHVPQPQGQTTSLVTDLNNNIATFSTPPQVQSTRVVSGLQVIPTKLQNGEIAFVLPGNIVGNNPVPNYIIPVYASANSSPVKQAVAMPTGTTTSGSFMTIVPSSDVFQTCAITPGSIGIMTPPVSSPSSSASPGSSSDYSTSPVRRDDIRDVRHIQEDVKEIRHVRDDVKDVSHIRDARHIQDNVKDLHPINNDVKEIRYHHNDVEIFRRHSYQMHEPVDTVWRPW